MKLITLSNLQSFVSQITSRYIRTIDIGTVTTGSEGSSASATITGTDGNKHLNLVIPRGNTGATGARGISVKSVVINSSGELVVTLE